MRERTPICPELLSCDLWLGSGIQLTHEGCSAEYFAAELPKRIAMLSRCDDRTPKENRFLKGLQAQLAFMRLPQF